MNPCLDFSPAEMSGARGPELSLSCSLLIPQYLAQWLARGRGLRNTLKLIPSLFCSSILPLPLHTQHSSVLRKGAFGTSGEWSVSTGKGVANMEISCTGHLKNVSVHGQPLLQRYMAYSVFGLGNEQEETCCVSAGESCCVSAHP